MRTKQARAAVLLFKPAGNPLPPSTNSIPFHSAHPLPQFFNSVDALSLSDRRDGLCSLLHQHLSGLLGQLLGDLHRKPLGQRRELLQFLLLLLKLSLDLLVA